MARCGTRKPIESVFGIVAPALGCRKVLLRGLDAVQGEWALVSRRARQPLAGVAGHTA